MEHFIETVRKYPCLWNTNAIEYRDLELKDAAWAEVMKETDLSSVKEVKLKWKKLRDSYRDALKRQSEMLAKEPANGAKKPYSWKYMGLMQFLQPYMGNRKKQGEASGFTSSTASAGAEHGLTNGAGAGADPRSDSDSESEAESEPKRKSCDRLSAVERKLDYLCRAHKRPAAAEPPAPTAPAPAPATAAPYRREQYAPAPAHALAPLPDPLDIFFNSMCQATKRFPFQTQIKIKKKLFGAVIEAEETLVAEQQSYASLWAQQAGSSSSSEGPDDGDGPDGRPS